MSDHPPRAQFEMYPKPKTGESVSITYDNPDMRGQTSTVTVPVVEHFGCVCPNCGTHLHGTLVVRK